MSKGVRFALAILSFISSADSQDLDPADVRITLDQALLIAMTKAKADFVDLEKYILHSVQPRALKGHVEGPREGALFWGFLWEEKAPSHYKQNALYRLLLPLGW